MWYVQVMDDNGEWCDYPSMESTSGDGALKLMPAVQHMLLNPKLVRIHPISSKTFRESDLSPTWMCTADQMAVRKRAENVLRKGPSHTDIYVVLNDVLQKIENQVDWEHKYEETKRQLDKKQNTIDKIYEFLE